MSLRFLKLLLALVWDSVSLSRMERHTRALCWIRRDLRLHDHAALAEATRLAKQVAVVFVFDRTILDHLYDRDDRRVSFIHDSLRELDSFMRERGSRLIVLHGDPRDEIPKLARKLKVETVFVNHDYEPSAIMRDSKVKERLLEFGIAFSTFKDQVIFERAQIETQSGTAFKVFTPYKNAWLNRLKTNPLEASERKPQLNALWKERDLPATEAPSLEQCSLEEIGFKPAALWLEAGLNAGRSRLHAFKKNLADYGKNRDFPSIAGTSGLSAHLRFGTVSVRECVRYALQNPSNGATVWLNELIWRDFYHMILARFPHIADGKSFKPEYDSIRWPGSKEHFMAWCEGRTGYPLVDAAMRHFNATGWMHNRLRMVVAMFLTKDLLVDWRLGEAYFARNLLDFDFAANNGGWQWSASTGCDAQPYFRIFNPITQSKRYDPDGDFIRSELPELKNLRGDEIHFPASSSLFAKGYPPPIVDHAAQRIKAIALFKAIS